jgi:type I restriction enzyme, S subunit
MSVELLLREFHRISEAPDAIPRLRRFILDLAVRGKLVSQDPNDEPAYALLKRIELRKLQLSKAKRMRAFPELPAVSADEVPYPLPPTWCWIRLGDAFKYDAGDKTEPSAIADGSWLLELEDLEKDSGKVLSKVLVEQRSPRSTKSKFMAGDVLYGKLRPYLNKAVVADAPGFSTTEIVAIRCYGDSAPDYTSLALRRPDFVAYVDRLGQGTKMPRLRTEDALRGLFPLPPVAEQHRIADRVEELINLCDELESLQTSRQARKDKLVTASLARLTAAADESSFKESARFYFNHLPRLSSRPEHLQILSNSMIDLAIRGKLPTRGKTDEPAYALMNRILSEKERLAIKAQIKLSTIENEAPFELPSSWAWARLGDLAVSFRYGTSKLCSYEKKGAPVLRIPNVSSGQLTLDDLKYAILSEKETEDLSLRAGDILMIRSNGSLNLVGRPAIVDPSGAGFCYAGYLVRVRFCLGTVNSYYITTVLNSSFVRSQIEGPIRSAVGLKNVNSTELGNLRIPLAPLNEQGRIVAMVKGLAELCSKCTTHIEAEDQAQHRFLNAAVQQALASEQPFAEIAAGA